jgi:flavin-dependent dehydrogenase
MMEAGAEKITRVSLVVANGKSVQSFVAGMSSEAEWAMSLSRARFDQILFDRARETGTICMEGVAVRGCAIDDSGSGRVEALSLKDGRKISFKAPIIVDASGRQSRLMVGKRERVAGRQGSRLYALKAHFNGIEGITDQVELHFFREGYGGMSLVEGGLVNLCFIVNEQALRNAGGDPAQVVSATLMNNRLARERLRAAQIVGKWHSAGPLTFGRRRLARHGVIAIGDASGMIDPFTGTGIQIALRTGEMVADAVVKTMGAAHPPGQSEGSGNGVDSGGSESVLSCYAHQYENEFHRRMRVAGLLRTAAFSPATARMVAGVLTHIPRLTNVVLRATRSSYGSRSRFDERNS